MAYNEVEYQKEYCKKYYQKNKEHLKARRQELYLANREECLAKNKEYRQTYKAKQSKIDRQRERRHLYPQIFRARKMVGRAVKAGILVRGVCEKCGDPRVEAHHDSYEVGNELKVRWFCQYHHKLIEGRILVPRKELPPQAKVKIVEV